METGSHVYAPNFLLLGDLTFDRNSDLDRSWSDQFLKTFDNKAGATANVNFPFLDVHEGEAGIFRTNARQDETYNQIGLFGPSNWVWSFEQNGVLPADPLGPDYGMFNFQELFAKALFNKDFASLTKNE